MATSLDRTTVEIGAGVVVFGGAAIYDRGAIVADLQTDWGAVGGVEHGRVGTGIGPRRVSVMFTPCARLTAATLAALYPHTAPLYKQSLYRSSGTVQVYGLSGQRMQAAPAAVSRMPSLYLGAQADPIGEAEILALLSRSDASYAVGSASPPALPTDQLIRSSYSATWGSTPIVAQGGWRVEFDLALESIPSAEGGVADLAITGLSVRAMCRPVNMGSGVWTNILVKDGLGSYNQTASGQTLGITADKAGGIDLSLVDAVPVVGPLRWGDGELRAGEVGFEAVSKRAGVDTQVFTIGVSA